MAIKNPILFWLIGIFVILNILDGITALQILPGESNPIFILFGGITPVLILKTLLIIGIIYYYRRGIYNSNFTYFMIIMVLLLGNILLLGGVASNIYGMKNPKYIEEVKNIPQQEKINSYMWLVSLIYLLPMFISLLGFKFYEWSIKKVVINEKYFLDKPWWKRW